MNGNRINAATQRPQRSAEDSNFIFSANLCVLRVSAFRFGLMVKRK